MNELELLFIEPCGWDHWGLPVVRICGGDSDGEEYAVADTDDEAQTAAVECARESLWAFNTEYLGGELGWESNQITSIKKMQSELCEDAQPIILQLLGDKAEEILTNAVDMDGRGHFLSGYDGEERDGEDISPALEGKLCYRM
jgi:hypothetical protein